MATPGVYVFTNNGWDAYTGRSDTDVLTRAKKSYRAAKYDRTVKIIPTTSARQAFLLECRYFHRLAVPDNRRHPKKPDGTNWHCPTRGCKYH